MLTFFWCFMAREFVEFANMEKQMNVKTRVLPCASIDTIVRATLLKRLTVPVRKLQMRIAKAVKSDRWGKVKVLQWLLTHSKEAKRLAVYKVILNKGGKTPGIDGITWKTDKQAAQAVTDLNRRGYNPLPLRRIYILKKDGVSKRPLSIPTVKDRAMQALYKMALDPIAETLADPNSYGFRWYRSCADAIQQAFLSLAQPNRAKWILEADIKSCFDMISHQWLIDHIPIDKVILKKWLKSGYMEKQQKFPTERGTPQGGIISPVLMNMTLDGLEREISKVFPRWRKSNVNFIRYADDFIITAQSREQITDTILPLVEKFMSERGLKLSPEKTKITHIDEGFDFLSQNIRKYKGKLLIKPSKNAVKTFKKKIADTIRSCRGQSAAMLIRVLNPVLRGWSNYHKHVVSKSTFWAINTYIHARLLAWAKKEHSDKKINWIIKRHFFARKPKGDFSAVETSKNGIKRVLQIYSLAMIPILRHVKIKAEANPFDKKYVPYFAARIAIKARQKAEAEKIIQ